MKACVVFVVLSFCHVALGMNPRDWAYYSLKTACSMMKHARSNFFTGTQVVAFQARANKRLVKIPKHHVVKFGEVITNKGNGYNGSTGKFTAPIGGVYFFDWTILVDNGDMFNTEIVKNGAVFGYSYCGARSSNLSKACTATARMEMKKGEKVWIRIHNQGDDAHFKWSTFGGHKL